jgi:hypothetical protein
MEAQELLLTFQVLHYTILEGALVVPGIQMVDKVEEQEVLA